MKNLNLIQTVLLGFVLLLAACSPAPAAEPLDAAEVDEPERLPPRRLAEMWPQVAG